MTTMNISLPDGLKAFVDDLVQTEGYGTSSEYVRELIRHDQDRRQFKEHLLIGMRSGIDGPMDATFFTTLRQRATQRTDSARKPA
jgi:antitoxin ParD1/3/4